MNGNYFKKRKIAFGGACGGLEGKNKEKQDSRRLFSPPSKSVYTLFLVYTLSGIYTISKGQHLHCSALFTPQCMAAARAAQSIPKYTEPSWFRWVSDFVPSHGTKFGSVTRNQVGSVRRNQNLMIGLCCFWKGNWVNYRERLSGVSMQ